MGWDSYLEMLIKGNQSIRANDLSMTDFQTLKIEHLSIFLSLLQVQQFSFPDSYLSFYLFCKTPEKSNFYEKRQNGNLSL